MDRDRNRQLANNVMCSPPQWGYFGWHFLGYVDRSVLINIKIIKWISDLCESGSGTTVQFTSVRKQPADDHPSP